MYGKRLGLAPAIAIAVALGIPLLLHAQQPAPAAPLSIVPAIDKAPTDANDYDWIAHHNAVLARIHDGQPVDMILVGDSITHGWGGEPETPRKSGPKDLWDKYFAPRNTVNLGFGWDRTEHVLWRLQNGEIDGIHPRVAVVLIGTNNLWRDSSDDVATGITQIVATLRHKLRRTKILLLGIFPHDHDANTVNRKKIAEVNAKIAELGKERNVTYLDLGSIFLDPDGTLPATLMPDFLHPNHRGYEIWARTNGANAGAVVWALALTLVSRTNPSTRSDRARFGL